jgi:hypothetical protein
MTLHSEHSPNHRFPRRGVDPLPGDLFEPELREIDAQLRRVAAQAAEEMPADLSDRVFAASVGLLPRSPAHLVTTARRDRVRVRRLISRPWAGRLAMAASLAFAFGVCSLFVRAPLGPPMNARGDRDGEILLAAYTNVLSEQPDEQELGHEMSYLLETGALSSYDELTGEMEALIAELEM